MSLKSEKLVKRIQEIQQFVAERIEKNGTFKAVYQDLEKIIDSLIQGKLTVQIFSQNPVSFQAIHNLFSTYKTLLESYHFQTIPLAKKSEQAILQPSAALILQPSSASPIGSQHTRYELTADSSVIIGRDRSQCQVDLPDRYQWVSGCHAEIRFRSNSEADSVRPRWEICDLNSRNGTYINGKLLQDCQSLKLGDRMTLGYKEPTEKSPEFIFECDLNLDSNIASESDKFYRELADCDVLCLVVELNQMLSIDSKHLIEKASQVQISLLIIVVEIPELDNQVYQQLAPSITELKTWLQSNIAGLAFEIVPLPLRPFYPDVQPTPIDSHTQKELDKFCKFLETLVKRKPEDILTKRLTAQVLSQIALLESFLNAKEEAMEKENQQDEAKLQALGGDDLRKKTDSALKQVNDEKIDFFRQIKPLISQAKADLVDEYLTTSISCKLRQTINKLKPYVAKKENSKYLELKAVLPKKKSSQRPEKTVNANTAIMDLCRSELTQWSNDEWNRICSHYAESGLRGLFQRSYAKLSSIPSLNFSNASFQPSQNIDIQGIFQAPFEEPPCETHYEDVSAIGFILKRIRSQWMQFLFLFSFLSILGFGGRRQIMRWITAPISGAFQHAFLPSILILIIAGYFSYKYLIKAFQKYRESEHQKEADKLRNNLRTYYQSLVKNRFLEKIHQSLILALEAEEQQFDELIKTVKQIADQTLTETESSSGPLKMWINKRKEQQNNLKKDLNELQKLKRI